MGTIGVLMGGGELVLRTARKGVRVGSSGVPYVPEKYMFHPIYLV
jgi:hypothetical protein